MNKNFRSYVLIWAIILAVWCAVVFLVRPVIPGYVINYDVRFWIAFVCIVAAFIGNFVCAGFAFKADNLKKLFYNLPLITVSWTALIVTLVAGSVIMLTPDCPAWIAAIVSIIVLGFSAIAVIKASWAAGTVSQTDDIVRTRTTNIRGMAAEANSLMARAKNPTAKAECKKVVDVLRYSDPMSSAALSSIEAKIVAKLDELSETLSKDSIEETRAIADEIVVLVRERNQKCKTMK